MLRGPAALALVALVVPFEASANTFGQCAQQTNPELKIAACTEASRSTSYPWILQWVYRDLARAHRERGEVEPALASYAHSLAARQDAAVRREMDELARVSDLPDINTLSSESDFTVFMTKDVPEDVRRGALRRLWALIELPVSCHELCHDSEPASPSLALLAGGERPIPSQ